MLVKAANLRAEVGEVDDRRFGQCSIVRQFDTKHDLISHFTLRRIRRAMGGPEWLKTGGG